MVFLDPHLTKDMRIIVLSTFLENGQLSGKNFLYVLLNRPSWRSHYVSITLFALSFSFDLKTYIFHGCRGSTPRPCTLFFHA